ncbi:hypothetical protein YC2023_078204 [Brassica napus]
MAVSPASVASTTHLLLQTYMVMDVSVLDSEFTADGGAGNSRNASFHPIPWNFSLSDLNCISVGDGLHPSTRPIK